VTNHHVVDGADEIEVTFESDEKLKAKVVGSDSRTDIAVLKLETDKTFDSFLNFASTEPRVGDWVLAVGNPFGLGGTVTAGIVSAGGRDIGSSPYDFLQIDAAVNRGNSGGPAVNLDGQVIGVNTAIFSPSGGNVGIAFAVPATVVKNVVDQLLKAGKVSRGWLGVNIQNLDDNLADSLGLKDTKGALVSRILPDGPAAKSELREEDVIVSVNGKGIENSRDLARTIAEMAPNVDAKMDVFRRGKQQSITVKLGEFPSNEQFAALNTPGSEEESGRELEDLGLSLAPAGEVPGSRDKEGVAITEVNPASNAAEQGLRKGDIILEVQGTKVSTPEDVEKGIRAARDNGRRAVLLQIRSRDQQRFVALPLKSEEGGASR
jgi:serine protease Do